MTGGKQYSSVMDILLDDEMYYKLYFFLERCERFLVSNESVQHSFFGDPNESQDGCTLEISYGNVSFGKYRSDHAALSLRHDRTYYHQNSVTSKHILAGKGAKHTDLSPIKDQVMDKVYDEVGWFITGNRITDEMEADLFQYSTVHNVYSLYEIQEVLNRIQNLPIPESMTLTIGQQMRYPMFNQFFDDLLKGY